MVDLTSKKLLLKERSIKEELSPRDLLFLKNLTRFGLSLIEIKVSPICPLIGKKLIEISFPEKSILINIVKNNESMFPDDVLEFETGDTVYFLCSQVSEDDLRKLFIPSEYI